GEPDVPGRRAGMCRRPATTKQTFTRSHPMTRFTSWLSSLRRALAGRPAPRRRSFRPGFEALEARDVPTVFLVSNTSDSGAGSLRQAILDANGHANVGGPDQIQFNITSPGREIFLNTALPDVTEAVVIDGTTQPGANGKPAIELGGDPS